MRRILLISDTHGNLDIINEKVAETMADMVIHAGGFGFYDEQSIYRLSQRELRLLVSHSPVWRQYEVDKQTNRERLIEIVKEHQLLGDFPDYISDKLLNSLSTHKFFSIFPKDSMSKSSCRFIGKVICSIFSFFI